MTAKLASIVIPCYNAERWVSEAVDSCLQQTYRPLEVVVIDDGSTDSSLKILQSYGSAIKLETGPNRGGNHARNRGFALSSGEYIQFLDADDYLLPDKIAAQVSLLERTRADVAYGDWRHQYHFPDGTEELGPPQAPGVLDDLLEALLGVWWVPPVALLYTRRAVEMAGGWDETLPVAQDRDFFIAAVFAGARACYQTGCYSVYRRHGRGTVSTSDPLKTAKSHQRVLLKYEEALRRTGRMTDRYARSLAASYFALIRSCEIYDRDRGLFQQLLEKVLDLDSSFIPYGPAPYRLVCKLAGPVFGERVLRWRRRVGHWLRRAGLRRKRAC